MTYIVHVFLLCPVIPCRLPCSLSDNGMMLSSIHADDLVCGVIFLGHREQRGAAVDQQVLRRKAAVEKGNLDRHARRLYRQ